MPSFCRLPPTLRSTFVLLALACTGTWHAQPRAAQETFDVLVRGGTVIDGTGAPSRVADVGIRRGRIAAVGMPTRR